MIRLALKEDTDVVVVAKDTDVLVLLIWAYVKYNVSRKWYLKYETDKYADIGAICDYFGKNIALTLPAFHSITGCDTTSYFLRAVKMQNFQESCERGVETWFIGISWTEGGA